MNYADIKKIDVANGEGVRVSVFVSGCNHHCKGCFNQCAWDFNYGKKFTEKEEQQIIDYMNHDYISGLSLLGGEPLEPRNQEGLLPLVKKVKEKFPNKDIWCYTGFDFEKDVVEKMAKNNETTRELLKYIDIIVDGKFEEDKKDLKLQFRGSSNQKIVDVKKSLQTGQIVKEIQYK
ncbi:MAG: anaerobic ribonucleoside-triphosphate reductase activating protein [Clostridium sp. 26_22]|nr:MAG: anaerobic ribonucleoside-triphosphate reductase activating protein [Clostridium sp. 26_22]